MHTNAHYDLHVQIRLILPGLGAVDKEESAAGAVKRTGTGDTCQKPGDCRLELLHNSQHATVHCSCACVIANRFRGLPHYSYCATEQSLLHWLAAAESAAAVAKARKKLLKIQGIANQAEKAHSSVIVDQRVLAAKAAVDEQGDAGSYGSGAGSAAVRGGGAAAGASLEKRTSRQGSSRAAIAGDAPSTGEQTAVGPCGKIDAGNRSQQGSGSCSASMLAVCKTIPPGWHCCKVDLAIVVLQVHLVVQLLASS